MWNVSTTKCWKNPSFTFRWDFVWDFDAIEPETTQRNQVKNCWRLRAVEQRLCQCFHIQPCHWGVRSIQYFSPYTHQSRTDSHWNELSIPNKLPSSPGCSHGLQHDNDNNNALVPLSTCQCYYAHAHHTSHFTTHEVTREVVMGPMLVSPPLCMPTIASSMVELPSWFFLAAKVLHCTRIPFWNTLYVMFWHTYQVESPGQLLHYGSKSRARIFSHPNVHFSIILDTFWIFVMWQSRPGEWSPCGYSSWSFNSLSFIPSQSFSTF